MPGPRTCLACCTCTLVARGELGKRIAVVVVHRRDLIPMASRITATRGDRWPALLRVVVRTPPARGPQDSQRSPTAFGQVTYRVGQIRAGQDPGADSIWLTGRLVRSHTELSGLVCSTVGSSLGWCRRKGGNRGGT